jgi:hypothetical protein
MSLLIDIAMSQVFSVGDKAFASSHTPTMWNFQFCSSRWEGNNEDTRQQIFEDSVEIIKSTANRWRVPQNVRRILPPHAHIDMFKIKDNN